MDEAVVNEDEEEEMDEDEKRERNQNMLKELYQEIGE